MLKLKQNEEQFSLLCTKKRQSETACGFWYSTIFIALKRTRGCITKLEACVTEYCLTWKTENLLHPTFHEYLVPQEKDDLKNILKK